VFACCDVALFRTGVPGTKHRRQHHGQTWQQHRCAGDHVVISTTRVDLVCDRQHGCPRDALLSGPRRPASARSSRVRARRYRIQADLVVGGGAAWSRDAWCAVSPSGGLPFQAVERTRQGLSANVPDRTGLGDRCIGPGPGRIERCIVNDDQRGSQLSSVRRQACFTPQSVPLTWTVTLRQLDRERAKP
jgi:hypothetical protein